MRILNVEHRDIHIVLDVSYTELEHILTYLNRCTASPDPNNPDWEKVDEFVRKQFFPTLDKLSDQIKGGV
uniref:Uncharacterized protein n=1 Tax=viral metagenome TaxID=1070528 RepID=A0A6M3LBP8_9ZZZZ